MGRPRQSLIERDCCSIAMQGASILAHTHFGRERIGEAECITFAQTASIKKPLTNQRLFECGWWRRRESNPRPQALYRQFYILSTII